MITHFGVAPERVTTIFNGLDLEELRSRAQEPCSGQEQTVQDGSFHFIAAGRLTEQKGFPLLVEAFNQVREKLPCRLLILGEGEQRPELERLVAQFGLQEDVALVGWTDNPFRLMRAADAFVLSSRYKGFPNVLLEAMAAGLPVISTDCLSGPSELLNKGEYGLLVPPDNVAALAVAMRRMITDDARQKMRVQAQVRIRPFDRQQMVEKFEDYFTMLAVRTAATRQPPVSVLSCRPQISVLSPRGSSFDPA